MTRTPPNLDGALMVEEVASAPSQAALLRNLLVYLGRRTPLRSARIQKLLYLVEADYADRTGRRLTDYRFKYADYGMFSPALREDVVSLCAVDSDLNLRHYRPKDGGRGFELTLSVDAGDGDLPDEVRQSCDHVLSEYGHLRGIKELAAAAKRTLPFVGTKRGGTVDWSILTDSCNRGVCDDELSEGGLKLLQSSADSK